MTYIFSATDLEYINNLNFFLKFGIREGDGADYVIILQQDESGEVGPLLCKPRTAVSRYCWKADQTGVQVPHFENLTVWEVCSDAHIISAGASGSCLHADVPTPKRDVCLLFPCCPWCRGVTPMLWHRYPSWTPSCPATLAC